MHDRVVPRRNRRRRRVPGWRHVGMRPLKDDHRLCLTLHQLPVRVSTSHMPDDMELRSNLTNQNRHVGCYEPAGIGMRHDGGEVELLHEGHDDLSVLNQEGCWDVHGSSYGRRCLTSGISRSAFTISRAVGCMPCWAAFHE